MADGQDVLARLLAPMQRDAFFGEHWGRRALHVPGPPVKFAGLFDRQAWLRSLPGCRVLKAGYRDADGWLRDFPIRPEQAEHLFRAGMTVCAGVLPDTGPLGTLLRGLERELLSPAPPHFNCYYSPDGHGFNLHIDDHPVFILQIEGAKSWLFSSVPGVANPTRGFQFPPNRTRVELPWGTFERPDSATLEQVELAPGDILYLPAGSWHEARARGASLALTLAFDRAAGLDRLREALSARIGRELDLAGILSPALAQDCGADPPEPLRSEFERVLRRLSETVARLEVADLYAAWLGSIAADRPSGVNPALAGR